MILPVSRPERLSLNNVHEPRNAEITAFLGSFLVE